MEQILVLSLFHYYHPYLMNINTIPPTLKPLIFIPSTPFSYHQNSVRTIINSKFSFIMSSTVNKIKDALHLGSDENKLSSGRPDSNTKNYGESHHNVTEGNYGYV